MDGEQSAPEPATAQDPQIAELTGIVNQARSLLASVESASQEAVEKRASIGQATQKLEDAATNAYSKLDEVSATVEEAQRKLEELRTGFESRATALNQIADSSTSEATAKVSELVATVAAAQATIQKILDELNEKRQAKLGELEAATQHAAARQAEAQAASSAASEHQVRAKQLLSEIEATKVEVVAHHSITSEALASKERFEKDAASSIQQFAANAAAASEKQKTFEENATAFETEIKRLTGEAEKMLFGATNAGLASSYKDEMKAIERSMRWDEVKFIAGILLLGVSLIPLYVYMSRVAAGHELSLASVAFRAAFLIPAAWLCYHYGRKIHASFELRHNYAHKSSLAASLEPFKRQAGDQGPHVVMAVFEQLLKNPASILRRHRKMGDGPAEAVHDATKPVFDEMRRMLPRPDTSTQ